MASQSTHQQQHLPPPPPPPLPPLSDHQSVAVRQPEPENLPCPRCASTKTKFCYYNNYNLSQPRHLCKDCRRYWTRGGTLRNVPVGGGTRKSSSSSRTKRYRSSTVVTTASSCSKSSTLTHDPKSVSCEKGELEFCSSVNVKDTTNATGAFTGLLHAQERVGCVPFPEFGLELGLNGMSYAQLGTWDWQTAPATAGGAGNISGGAVTTGCNTWQLEDNGGDGFSWPELANVAVVEELRWSLLVVDKHHLSTDTMYSILQEEGVTDVTLMKWGKHGVVVVCKTEVELHRCQQIASKSKHSFVYAQRFDPSATKQSRFIWVELSGVPVAAWSEASLDDMNVIWDEWLYVAKQSKELRCLDKLQVFIKTEKLMKLDKEVQMRFKGQSFKAKIREFDVEVLLDFEHPEDTISSADENKFGSPVYSVEDETRKSKTASGKMMEEENSNFEPAGEIQIESTKEASRDIRIGFPRIQISNNVQGVGQDGRVSNVQTEPEVEPPVSCLNLVVDGVHGLEEVSMVPDTCEAYLTQADNPNVKEVQHPQDKKHSKCTSRACENLRKKAEERKSLLKSKATTCKNSIRRGSRKGNQKGQEELVQLQDVDLSEDVSEEDEWESTAVQIGKEVGADLKMKGIDNRYDPLWKDFVTNIISRDKYRGGDRKVGVETLRQEESQTPHNLSV